MLDLQEHLPRWAVPAHSFKVSCDVEIDELSAYWSTEGSCRVGWNQWPSYPQHISSLAFLLITTISNKHEGESLCTSNTYSVDHNCFNRIRVEGTRALSFKIPPDTMPSSVPNF
jgi:hypothetical protein